MLLAKKLLTQGYQLPKLISSLKKFYGRQHELVDRPRREMNTTRTTTTALVLCGIILLAILYNTQSVDNPEIVVNSFPAHTWRVPLGLGNRTRNNLFNLPLCGQQYESFIFNISSGKMSVDVKTIDKNTPRHLCRSSFRARNSTIFTAREKLSYDECRKENSNPVHVRKINHEYLVDIRRQFFSYLKDKKKSSVIEIGGFKGGLAKSFLENYKIQNYVVVEPIRKNYEQILKTTQYLQRPDVSVYQFGLGNKYFNISVQDDGDATSLFLSKSEGTSRVQIVHTIDFFLLLGIACHDIDLLTINCEGCEFDTLEMLASTNLIDRFVHIQFQPHCGSKEDSYLGDCPCRYCRIRQLLGRTHEIAYSFPHIWEAWRRKPRL